MSRPKKWAPGRPIRTVRALEKAAHTPGTMFWVRYGWSYERVHHPTWVRNWNYSIVIRMLENGSLRLAVVTPEYRAWDKKRRARQALREIPF